MTPQEIERSRLEDEEIFNRAFNLWAQDERLNESAIDTLRPICRKWFKAGMLRGVSWAKQQLKLATSPLPPATRKD
jgi:hypothetical protein